MELSKTFQVSADYKDCRNTVNWETLQFAEIIFVDKTHSLNRPLLYQLNEHKLSIDQLLNICKSASLSFSRDAFVLVGEVLHIDKKKKQISLNNKNIIAYTHLVIASGKKPVLSFQNEELAPALQALTDALRVKPKIPASLPTYLKSSSILNCPQREPTFAAIDQSLASQDNHTIGKVVHPHIIAVEPNLNPQDLDRHNSRFYEVQT